MDRRKRGTGLLGRGRECALLDQLIAAVRMGESRVLVVHGAPGVGKSALLEYTESTATGMRVLRAAGVESEMELAFATLHQLCAPLLDRLENLPVPQRDALQTVFGMRGGTSPERFLVGLAVLSLLSDASEGGPLLCVVDDAQWMDRASAQVLGFVARRLLAESVALVFGSREWGQDLLGLPELEVTGLKAADAHALLDSVTHVRIDQDIRDRFVAETRGNPLALLELPRELAVTQVAGGSGHLDADTLPSRIERSFLARIDELPEQTRLLLLIAAAEPVGDPSLVWRAAERLGVTPATVLASGTDGLLEFDVRVIFRHPLVRSAVYGSAKEEDRRAVHLALAEVTDARADPDRRAWHLASATAAPDESVAAELERVAGRAQARGGLAAAAAFLQRSVALTIDPSRRAERALTAADAGLRAGDIEAARRFTGIAERNAQDEFQRVRAHLVRGHITFATGFNNEAPLMLLTAAQRLEPFDMDLARETYFIAWASVSFGAGNRDSLMAISRAMRELPAPEGGPRALGLVLEGYALLITDGRSAALPTLRRAKEALTNHPVQDLLKWGWAACGVSALLWEDRIMPDTPARAVEAVRTAGALSELPLYLHSLGIPISLSGDFAAAAALVAQADAVADATGVPMARHTELLLTAMRGREADITEPGRADDLVQDTLDRFGRLDILVNNAGLMLAGPIAGADLTEWTRMVGTNLLGSMYMIHAALPHLLESKGAVVQVSSTSGRIASAGNGAYAATKFGITAFAEALRQEVTAQGVRVVLVESGFVATELTDHITDPAMRAAARDMAAAMRTLRPEDIAGAVVYAVTQPEHVAVNEILIRPTDQTR